MRWRQRFVMHSLVLPLRPLLLLAGHMRSLGMLRAIGGRRPWALALKVGRHRIQGGQLHLVVHGLRLLWLVCLHWEWRHRRQDRLLHKNDVFGMLQRHLLPKIAGRLKTGLKRLLGSLLAWHLR